MEFTLNAAHLMKIFESTKDLVVDITLKVTKDGIYSQTLDMARICICELRLSPGDCESFEHEQDCEITFNLPNLIKCLKCFSDKESVTVSYAGSDKLVLTGQNSCYEIPLMDIDVEYMDLSSVTYDNSVLLNAKRWSEILEKHSFLNSDCELSFIKGGVHFKFESELGKATLLENVKQDDVNSLCDSMDQLTMKNAELGEFSMRYLLACTKINRLADDVHIEYNELYPLRITTALSKDSFLRCYIAPKEI